MTLQRGHRLHSHVEHTLLAEDEGGKEEEEVDDDISRNHVKSIEPIIGDFSKPYAIESRVVHPNLSYMGYLDCVALYKNRNLVLVDWKTSGKRKKSVRWTFDNPLQIAAYAGALNHDPNYNLQGRHSPNVSTIFLRLFLLQFFSKPIRMHQILPHKEELRKNCRIFLERFCGPSTGRGGRE
jgi:hypothetical protein